MKSINDVTLKNYYIKEFSINSYFSKNITEEMNMYEFNADEYICASGETSNSLLFLVKGKCRISQMRGNGKSILLRFGTPPFLIGDLEYVIKDFFDCNAQCVEKSLIISVPYSVLNFHCEKDPVFWKKISEALAIKMHISSVTNSINLLYPLENRLASYLIATSNFNDSGEIVTDMVTSKLSDIADLLGTTYRHLARTLNLLVSKNIISRDKRAIVIEDLEKLKALAGDIYI